MKRSPINYMGGKFNSLKFILPIIPERINTFYDMFAGSGTVALNVEASKYVINDRVTPLIELHDYLITNNYEQIHDNILKDISQYELHNLEGNGYLRLRKEYNEDKCPRKLYALTQHSFNYLMRFNMSGEFNASFGKGKCKLGKNALTKLKGYTNHFNDDNTTTLNKDFRDLFDVATIKTGDYVYLDPPYEQTLANYNERRGFTGWEKSDAEDVREMLVELDSNGISFGYSNTIISKGEVNDSLVEFIEENNFHVYSKEGFINGVPSTRKHRGKDVEVFITNVKEDA